jgi:N-hydroxyarylamine O-acetyltransferase
MPERSQEIIETGLRRFDLAAYLSRIRYGGEKEVTPGVLVALHAAHLAAIPFENLDILLGRPILLDIMSLEEKLVRACRGGYCFEQNTLFAAVLRSLGFQVSTLEARVRPPGVTAILPRTHMVLRVDLGGRAWLADVGFGGDGPLYPVPLRDGVSEQPGGSYRVMFEDKAGVLQLRRRGAWTDLYAFTLVPAYPVDFEVANHFTSTYPKSPFLKTLTVQIVKPDARHVLRGRTYNVRRGDAEETLELSEGEVVRLVRERFGLPLSEEEISRALLGGNEALEASLVPHDPA